MSTGRTKAYGIKVDNHIIPWTVRELRRDAIYDFRDHHEQEWPYLKSLGYSCVKLLLLEN